MPDPGFVAVAMSGGVDSSVTAALLKDEGFQVIGMGMRLFDEPGGSCSDKSCCGSADMDDARAVAEALDLPFYVLDLTAEFAEHVIDYFVRSYISGVTPNPCVPCNEVLKFEALLAAARRLGAERLATGHYARVEEGARESGRRFLLKKGLDESKDQSYFLYSLSQEQLARALFPLGEMTKTRVRSIAESMGLAVHDKPESQDVCFAGVDGYSAFLERHAGGAARPGPVLDEDGQEIGQHKGLYHYTVGQRRGLGVSGPEPLYVIDIDPGHNAITVAPASRLARQQELLLEHVNYVSVPEPDSTAPIQVMAKTRYRKTEVEAVLFPEAGGAARVKFDEPQEPTAPGQSVVMYDGHAVICGGTARRG